VVTNAGFADCLPYFAKIDGEKFTGFLIDAKAEGYHWEQKNSSVSKDHLPARCFNNVKVPVEKCLGEIGSHKLLSTS